MSCPSAAWYMVHKVQWDVVEGIIPKTESANTGLMWIWTIQGKWFKEEFSALLSPLTNKALQDLYVELRVEESGWIREKYKRL